MRSLVHARATLRLFAAVLLALLPQVPIPAQGAETKAQAAEQNEAHTEAQTDAQTDLIAAVDSAFQQFDSTEGEFILGCVDMPVAAQFVEGVDNTRFDSGRVIMG